jgi:predicted PurR-regulated permease PerM
LTSGSREQATFVQRVLVVVLIVFGVALLLFVTARLAQVLLLLFAGILLAIFLRAITNFLRDKTGMKDGLALMIVIFTLALITFGAGWFMAPSVYEQGERLAEAIPLAIQDLRADVGQYEWGQTIIRYIDTADPVADADPGQVIEQARTVVSLAMGGFIGILLILFIGIYLAAKPQMYKYGLVRLVPVERRPRAHEVIDACVETLKRWLIGRILLMVGVGLMTGISLAIMGIPLALVLGILAALLEFIPNVGPILAAIPALLIAWTIDPVTAGWVALLYFVIQQVESFVLTPLVMRKTVELPPVITILALFAFGLLLGPLGVVLATPITAVALVLVKMLYVEDALGDKRGDKKLFDDDPEEEDRKEADAEQVDGDLRRS